MSHTLGMQEGGCWLRDTPRHSMAQHTVAQHSKDTLGLSTSSSRSVATRRFRPQKQAQWKASVSISTPHWLTQRFTHAGANHHPPYSQHSLCNTQQKDAALAHKLGNRTLTHLTQPYSTLLNITHSTAWEQKDAALTPNKAWGQRTLTATLLNSTALRWEEMPHIAPQNAALTHCKLLCPHICVLAQSRLLNKKRKYPRAATTQHTKPDHA